MARQALARRRAALEARLADGADRMEGLLAEAACERGDVFALLASGGTRSRIRMEALAAATSAGLSAPPAMGALIMG